MKKFINLLILFAAFGAAAFETEAQNEKRLPVIVELFTSEGCSTCPPADEYLQMLIKEQPIAGAEIIALSEHVDYWNRLGWTDRFSSAQFSNRQGYYSAFFKSEIYTPQMIIDGTREFVGKDGNKQFTKAAQNPKGEVSLKIENRAENIVSVKVKIADLPNVAVGDKAVVLLAVTENDLTSRVSGGENSGRKFKHMAVTRYLKNIGAAAEDEKTLFADVTLEKDWKREHLSLVAFVQEERGRRILGAAKISLKN